MSERVEVAVGDRTLSLSNLDKVLYPEFGFTKSQVIDYYARIAPFMVPHIAGRCITLRRWPNGVDEQSFFEKRCPGHRPGWVTTALGPGDGDEGIEYCRLDDHARFRP
jgi:bifunctional non-homologous end joining protein LigD